jgi:hydroxyacylglutathione hydrolase
MNRALTYLGTLPDETVVHNGHEYTASSLAFGKSIDPENKALARLADIVKQNKITTGLTTIGDEKEWNVFMHLNSDAVRSVFLAHIHPELTFDFLRNATSATTDTPDSTIMDSLRDKKNSFRG